MRPWMWTSGLVALVGCAGSRVDDRPPPSIDNRPGIVQGLDAVEGITIVDYEETPETTYVFVSFTVPLDHDVPDGPTLELRGTVHHNAFGAPMILSLSGYHDHDTTHVDLNALLTQSNQVTLDKRFHGNSLPEGAVDWTLLAPDQIAGDIHTAVVRLKEVYGDGWISSGVSMGGIDVLHHRMRYPDDVGGTVAASAALIDTYGADGAAGFFADPPDPLCQSKLEAYQQAMLTDEALWADIVARAESWEDSREAQTYERIGSRELALESTLVSLPWTFWQTNGGDDCEGLADVEVDPVGAGLEFVNRIWPAHGPPQGSDAWFETFAPYYCQAAAWNGAPAVPREHLDGLLSEGVVDLELGLLPDGATMPAFAPASPELLTWLQTDASQVQLLYGARDPWSYAAPELATTGEDVHVFTSEAHTHALGVVLLEEPELTALSDRVLGWMGQ